MNFLFECSQLSLSIAQFITTLQCVLLSRQATKNVHGEFLLARFSKRVANSIPLAKSGTPVETMTWSAQHMNNIHQNKWRKTNR